jgi:tRNA nucleotidyltransferase (CCA-adding enzyme)
MTTLLAALPAERLRLLQAISEAAEETGNAIFLVGGAVRDLLLGQVPGDLDLAMEGNAWMVARRAAGDCGARLRWHPRFLTASLEIPGAGRLDLATTRTEVYRQPAALPRVHPAPLRVDLARRDFTINAMAVRLTRRGPADLVDPLGGRRDLRSRRIRVLHPASFSDDPSRAFRACRYAARLEFRLEDATRRWLREMVSRGDVRRLSAARLGAEFVRLAAEERFPAAVSRLRRARLLAAVHPDLRDAPPADCFRRLRRQLDGLLGRRRTIGVLALLVAGCRDDRRREALARIQVPVGTRRRVLQAAAVASDLLQALPAAGAAPLTDTALWTRCHKAPIEALDVAEAVTPDAGQRAALRRYRGRLSGIRLAIGARDLLRSGLAEGPDLRRRLEATMRARLAGRVRGRRAELAFALSREALADPGAERSTDRA